MQTENKIEVTQWKQGTGFYIQDGINIADNVILNNVEARCDFKIFPNPVSSELKIEFDIKDQCFTNIFIANNLGKRKSILKEDLQDLKHKIKLIKNNDLDYLDMLYREKLRYGTKDEILIKLK